MNITKSKQVQIEWDLTCSDKEALKILSESIDDKLSLRCWKVSGIVDGKNIKIWTKTPVMRGTSIAVGKGQLSPKDSQSHLSATLAIVWPFHLFQFPKKIVIFVALLAVCSGLLTLTGAIFSQYKLLPDVFFPIGSISALIVLLNFIRSLGESELNDLRNFLENLFASLRQ